MVTSSQPDRYADRASRPSGSILSNVSRCYSFVGQSPVQTVVTLEHMEIFSVQLQWVEESMLRTALGCLPFSGIDSRSIKWVEPLMPSSSSQLLPFSLLAVERWCLRHTYTVSSRYLWHARESWSPVPRTVEEKDMDNMLNPSNCLSTASKHQPNRNHGGRRKCFSFCWSRSWKPLLLLLLRHSLRQGAISKAPHCLGVIHVSWLGISLPDHLQKVIFVHFIK